MSATSHFGQHDAWCDFCALINLNRNYDEDLDTSPGVFLWIIGSVLVWVLIVGLLAFWLVR